MKNEQIGSKIRNLRNRKGLSQELLAEQAGINHRTVQRIENGESQPTGDTITRIAKTLDVSIGELMDRQLEENRQFLLTMNLATFTFMPFPILGFLIPFIMWMTKKDQIHGADQLGRSITNFQVNWLLLLLCVPIQLYIGSLLTLIKQPTFSILFQWLMGMYLVNILFILGNGVRIYTNKNEYYPSWIKLI